MDRTILQEATDRIVQRAAALKVGDPQEDGVNIGPLINANFVDSIALPRLVPGGRVHYFGAGASGRLAVLDALDAGALEDPGEHGQDAEGAELPELRVADDPQVLDGPLRPAGHGLGCWP